MAEEAFVLAYPLAVMIRTMLQATAVAAPEPDTMRAPLNTLVHGRHTPDMLRVSGWIDLADEPVVLSVPDTHGRYYAVWLRDAWTNLFASVGARTSGTASRTFAIAGPGRHGAPTVADSSTIAAPTRMVHVTGCIEAVPAAYDEAQDGFALSPLGARPRDDDAPAGRFSAAAHQSLTPVEQVERMSARAFFADVGRLLDDNPSDAACRAAFERLRLIGAWNSPAPELRAQLERGVRAGRRAVRARTSRARPETSGDWQLCSDFGHHSAGPLERAAAACSGLVAGPAADVFHAQLDIDADGRPLTGDARYTLRFPPDSAPPVHGFWSLTTYPDRRDGAHAIGDRRGLAMDPDGSLRVHLQHRAPGRNRRANWLPTPSARFSVALYLYWPGDAALQRQWSPPPVTRVV
jgi:hypothetical protein